MNDKLDIDIKNALKNKADNIYPSETLLPRIRAQLYREDYNMKFSLKKKGIIVAAAAVIIMSACAIAAGKKAYSFSHSSHADDITYYPTQAETAEKVGYTPKYVQDLCGHKFMRANVGEGGDVDADGNELNNYKEISFWYETDKGILMLNTNPYTGGDEQDEHENAEAIPCGDITLYYTKNVYMSVPPDYKPTDEERAREQSGELMIGYGSDTKEVKNMQSVVWVEDGIEYCLLDMGAEISAQEFKSMPQQIINS